VRPRITDESVFEGAVEDAVEGDVDGFQAPWGQEASSWASVPHPRCVLAIRNKKVGKFAALATIEMDLKFES
jgi:hypothetical protein